MADMLDDDFARELLRLLPRSGPLLEKARLLAADLEGAGFPMAVDEILVRLGGVDETSRRAACAAAGGPAPTPVSFRDAQADRRAVQQAVVSGTIGPEGLENVRAFQAWAAEQGLSLAVADVLEKRGFVPAEPAAALPVAAPPLPAPRAVAPMASAPVLPVPRTAPPPLPPRRPATTRSRRRTERQPARGRTERMARSRAAPKPPQGLLIALGVGIGALVLLVLAVLVVGLAGEDATPAPVESASPSHAKRQPATEEKDEPEPPVRPAERPPEEEGPEDDEPPVDPPDPEPQDPGPDLDGAFRELEGTVARALEEGDAGLARREVDAFQARLESDAEAMRFARGLSSLRARIEEALAAKPPEDEPEPPRPDLGPRREVDLGRTIGEGLSTEELERQMAEAAKWGRWELAVQYQTLLLERLGRLMDYGTRAQLYLQWARPYLALQDLARAEEMTKALTPQAQPQILAQIYSMKSQACSSLLEFQSARREAERFMALVPGEPLGFYLLALTYRIEGDLDRAIEYYRRSCERSPQYGALMDLGLSWIEKGNREEALRAFAEIDRAFPERPLYGQAAACGRAWAMVHPAVAAEPDLAGALALVEREAPFGPGYTPYQVYLVGALYSMAGDHRRAYRLFTRQFVGWENTPEAGYYYARTCLALGYEDEAREVFQRAYRLRPGFAAQVPLGLEEKRELARAKAEAGRLAERPIEERQALREVEERMVLQLSQIRGIEASYRFAEAAKAYRDVAGRLDAPEARAEADLDAERAAALEKVMARIVEVAGKGGLAETTVRLGDSEARIVGGDLREAELRIGEGSARVAWAFLPLAAFAALAGEVDPSPAEWLALGTLCLAEDSEGEAWAALGRASRDPKSKDRIDRLVAARRGMDVPKGGFVYHRGSFVAAEEKERLDRGLVLFRGEWVTPEDRERVLHGYQRVKGEWTRLTQSDLVARGWEKTGDEWLTPAELAAKKGLWSDARERTTEHFVLRSDRGESFLEELATAIEAAWPEYERFFGARPPGDRKLVVLAFKDFDGYREYCRKLGRDDVLGALGFAPSEEYTCCGYDKFGDVQVFLGTLVHEAAHLYFWTSFGRVPPSWLAEGTATYFEGFRRIGDRYEFDRPSASRLATLRAGLLARGFDLESLLAGDAAALIARSPDQAVEFYARSWGLVYFLARSVDPAVREIFEAAMDRARRGESVDLLALVGPQRRKAFESALLSFLKHI